MSGSSAVRAAGAASLVFLSALSSPARAEPPATTPATTPPASGDKALAEALFRAAKELKEAGNLAEACPKFVESHRLEPKPGTILNAATCHEEEGKTATAWAEYGEAATIASRLRQSERERFARGKIEELEKKLSYVTFQLPKVPLIEMSLDGKALTSASAGTRVPLDPGEHVVEARAPGRTPWSTRLRINPGPSERTVAVPLLAEATDKGEPAGPSAGGPASGAADGDSSATRRTLGWASVGLGVVGLAVGTGFGIKTLGDKSTVDEHCRGALCDAIGLEANDAAYTSATISTVGFVVGGLALAGGIVLLLTTAAGPPRDPARGARTSRAVLVW